MSETILKPDNLIEIAPSPKQPIRIDLACGQNKREGFIGCDIYPGANVDMVVDLQRFPWPWMTSSVDEIHCSHFIEHLEMCYWGKDKKTGEYCHKLIPDSHEDKELFFAFFDEVHRILKPEGRATIICPAAYDRGFQDPTHRRFIVAATFLYLSEDWRKANKLDHYNVKCAFSQELNATYSPLVEGRTEEVKRRMADLYRNILLDFVLHLVCKKDDPTKG